MQNTLLSSFQDRHRSFLVQQINRVEDFEIDADNGEVHFLQIHTQFRITNINHLNSVRKIDLVMVICGIFAVCLLIPYFSQVTYSNFNHSFVYNPTPALKCVFFQNVFISLISHILIF